MWTGARNSPARNASERETRSKTGRRIFGEAFRVPAAEKGNWTGKTAPLSGAAKGTGYGASAGEEGGWPRTVTGGNQEAGDGQGAVGGRRRAQAGLGARAGSVAPRLSSETREFMLGVSMSATTMGARGKHTTARRSAGMDLNLAFLQAPAVQATRGPACRLVAWSGNGWAEPSPETLQRASRDQRP